MPRSRCLSGAGLTLLTTVSLGVLQAPPAQAANNGTAYADSNIGAPGTVVFTAGTGRENQIVISGMGGMVTIDDAFPITPGWNCAQVTGDPTRVNCYVLDPMPIVYVSTLGWNDSITNNSFSPMVAKGGEGDDIIIGGGNDDRLYGGEGADQLYGFNGKDWVSGDDGNDRVSGGEGNDTLFAGYGDDLLYGSYGDDILDAGRGNDRLDGGPNDTSTGDICRGIVPNPMMRRATRDVDVKTGCEG